MINITECEACGRVIPATEDGCAYCERERGPRPDRPYLPLAIRLLLALFGLNVVTTFVWGVLAVISGISHGAGVLAMLPGTMRALASVAALIGLIVSGAWGWRLCVAYVGLEASVGAAVLIGVLPVASWGGALLAPIWTLLFVFVLLRFDVRSRFDRSVADRREVLELIRSTDDPTAS